MPRPGLVRVPVRCRFGVDVVPHRLFGVPGPVRRQTPQPAVLLIGGDSRAAEPALADGVAECSDLAEVLDGGLDYRERRVELELVSHLVAAREHDACAAVALGVGQVRVVRYVGQLPAGSGEHVQVVRIDRPLGPAPFDLDIVPVAPHLDHHRGAHGDRCTDQRRKQSRPIHLLIPSHAPRRKRQPAGSPSHPNCLYPSRLP